VLLERDGRGRYSPADRCDDILSGTENAARGCNAGCKTEGKADHMIDIHRGRGEAADRSVWEGSLCRILAAPFTRSKGPPRMREDRLYGWLPGRKTRQASASLAQDETAHVGFTTTAVCSVQLRAMTKLFFWTTVCQPVRSAITRYGAAKRLIKRIEAGGAGQKGWGTVRWIGRRHYRLAAAYYDSWRRRRWSDLLDIRLMDSISVPFSVCWGLRGAAALTLPRFIWQNELCSVQSA